MTIRRRSALRASKIGQLSPSSCKKQQVQALLALHETHAPVWGHDRAANDGRQLLHDCIGRGAHEKVEVKDTPSDTPLNAVLRQHHVHCIAVDQRNPMRLAACTLRRECSVNSVQDFCSNML